jgi:hypothetical protein
MTVRSLDQVETKQGEGLEVEVLHRKSYAGCDDPS